MSATELPLAIIGCFCPVFSLEDINIDVRQEGWPSSQSLSLSLSLLSLPHPPSYTHALDVSRRAQNRQTHSASASLSLLHLGVSVPSLPISAGRFKARRCATPVRMKHLSFGVSCMSLCACVSFWFCFIGVKQRILGCGWLRDEAGLPTAVLKWCERRMPRIMRMQVMTREQ